MKKLISKIIVSIVPIITMCLGTCLSDNVSGHIYYVGNPDAVSGINLPGIVEYNFEGGNELLIIARNLFNRALEYLPMLILVLLLLACLKMIFEGDGKAGFKRIKYILIGVALMILSIYVMNIVSTIISGHSLIQINLNRWY